MWAEQKLAGISYSYSVNIKDYNTTAKCFVPFSCQFKFILNSGDFLSYYLNLLKLYEALIFPVTTHLYIGQIGNIIKSE